MDQPTIATMEHAASSDRDHWNLRYSELPWPTEPSPWLIANAPAFASPGTALDVAGGTGRNAIWLAAKGWDVTIVDISHIALEIAATRAQKHDVTCTLLERDLTEGNLPLGPWDAIMVFHYLDRSLFRAFPKLLNRGGILIGSLATVKNLERHARPPLPYLLDDAELPGLLTGLEIISYDESWDDGYHDARFLARKGNSDQHH